MKIKLFIITTILTFIVCKNLYGDPLYYYGFGDTIRICLISDKIALYLTENRRDLINQELTSSKIDVAWINTQLCVISNMSNQNINTIHSILHRYSINNSYLPVYSINNSSEAILFPEIILQPRSELYDLCYIIEKYGLRLVKNGTLYKRFSLPVNSNPIEVANAIYETGDFLFSYPKFFTPFKSYAHIPNDTYFSYQITCHNIGQTINDGHSGTFDADIDAPEAWDITKGSPDVIVAVFDEGVTSNHPDLPNTRQVRLNGSNFGSGDPNDPSPTGDSNHGNSCAGVIAATMDNNEGIAGIAPNCKIMPLRLDDYTSDTDLADGIEFAMNNGANILSCSWGLGNLPPTSFPVIISAIESAINNGVVVIFAASNSANNSVGDHGTVAFPANANISNLITVGASDRYDHVAEYSPCSSRIDIVAPSHRAYPFQISGETFEMWSIDIPGNSGYNPVPSSMARYLTIGEILPDFGTNYLSYTGRFGGTSHACPVVAGVVALMLSVNPLLTPSEVYEILTTTADKVGGYSYVNGRCNEMGYGRVNAFAAVEKAKKKFIQNKTYVSGTSMVEYYPEIFVGYSVSNDAPYGNVVIKSGSNVAFKASEAIHLRSGFRVEKGATYHASINPSITSPSSSAPERNSGKGSTRQDYLPMLKSTSWTSIEKSLEDITATIYYQLGDTMIGSNKYIKTKYTGVNLSNNVVWHDPWDRVELYREDSSTKRVYLRDAYDNTDILLFDFSLQIGDTLPFWPYYPLTEISTISNSGQTRRKFVFTNSTDTIVWVEGVGNYVKPFSPTAFLNHIYSSRVLCVKMGDDVVYNTEPFMNTYTCSNVSEAAKQHMANEQIVSSNGYVYPTVTASFIHLIGYDALQSVYIYNLSGQLVLQTTETDIDVSALPAGVYVVHAQTANNQLLTTKFVHL